ncbi:MAG: hypothetical protein IJM92_17925 [Fibrobacter sp.]|uniref:hypothetical protein n=1 Tax=Fibrobacter sp. TaxID=35828 RepID=UPI0025C6E81D|nr:hypothetical protein [Fibrobacter sp.]MBQ7081495.1 hypothetical protein [Fibrobacter sp.]
MFDKHADEAIEAEIWLKGREQGREQERAKNEVAKAARDKKIAEYLRSIGVSEDGVAKALSIK